MSLENCNTNLVSKVCLRNFAIKSITSDLDEFRFDVFIKHELWEDVELLAEELVGEVDGRVHDAGAVCADGVGDMADVDRVQMFVVAWALHKDLQQQFSLDAVILCQL